MCVRLCCKEAIIRRSCHGFALSSTGSPPMPSGLRAKIPSNLRSKCRSLIASISHGPHHSSDHDDNNNSLRSLGNGSTVLYSACIVMKKEPTIYPNLYQHYINTTFTYKHTNTSNAFPTQDYYLLFHVE